MTNDEKVDVARTFGALSAVVVFFSCLIVVLPAAFGFAQHAYYWAAPSKECSNRD